MYVSMKDILTHADKHNYAVMAVNSVNMEMARAVITAAEEEHSPTTDRERGDADWLSAKLPRHSGTDRLVPHHRRLERHLQTDRSLGDGAERNRQSDDGDATDAEGGGQQRLRQIYTQELSRLGRHASTRRPSAHEHRHL